LRLLSVLTLFGFSYLMTGRANSLSPTSELLTCHWSYAPPLVSAVQHTNPIWILHLPVIVFASLHLSAVWKTNSRTWMCLFAMMSLLQVQSYTITAIRGRLVMFCVIAGQLVHPLVQSGSAFPKLSNLYALPIALLTRILHQSTSKIKAGEALNC
jgi:hypothetical protein